MRNFQTAGIVTGNPDESVALVNLRRGGKGVAISLPEKHSYRSQNVSGHSFSLGKQQGLLLQLYRQAGDGMPVKLYQQPVAG